VLFNTFQFAIFLAAVVLLYRALPMRVRNPLLLGASLFFYVLWIPSYLPLLLLDIGVNYALLRGMRKSSRPKLYMLTSIVFTMGLLVCFKYAAMLIASIAPGWLMLTGDALPMPEILLPLGISFYSFQIVSYSVDSYWNPKHEIPSLPRYALFISFFPQLIAGPILRGRQFLPQIDSNTGPSPEQIRRGFWLLTSGVVKKVIFADFLIAPFVDQIFGAPGVASGPFHWIAIYSFCFQIYFDFSGYTDMGRGMALLMGFELPLNFTEPYLAVNPHDFWRRWHITLSSWFSDYVFMPLSFNKRMRSRLSVNGLIYVSLAITWTLTGLWHGAGWQFVLWGVYQALLLALHRFCRPILNRVRTESEVTSAGWWLLRWIATFNLVALGLVLFRSDSLSQTLVYWRALFAGGEVSGWPVMQTAIVLLCLASHVAEGYLRPRLPKLQVWCAGSLAGVALEGGLIGLILAIAIIVAGAGGEFIYFQF
jgi:alginate O-acetyltransferase complex protein AlgI